jgi:glycosyltransferase involved in cell wall biosynthesis
VQEGENGFIINDTSDADYIASKIGLLLDENIHSLMAQRALDTAAQNTWAQVAAKYSEVYSSVLTARKTNLYL